MLTNSSSRHCLYAPNVSLTTGDSKSAAKTASNDSTPILETTDAESTTTETYVVGSSEECTPLNQLAFIKTHKTGSTTLRLIVDIYGYYRNLSFMLNKNDSKTGHIRNMKLSRKNLLPPVNVTSRDYDRYIHNFDMCSVHYKVRPKNVGSCDEEGEQIHHDTA